MFLEKSAMYVAVQMSEKKLFQLKYLVLELPTPPNLERLLKVFLYKKEHKHYTQILVYIFYIYQYDTKYHKTYLMAKYFSTFSASFNGWRANNESPWKPTKSIDWLVVSSLPRSLAHVGGGSVVGGTVAGRVVGTSGKGGETPPEKMFVPLDNTLSKTLKLKRKN